MFEGLRKYRYVFVVGHFRSHTRIASKMIAHDTGHFWLPEDVFDYSSLERLYRFVDTGIPLVIQCPFLTHVIHELATEDGIVVYLHRRLEEILRSEENAILVDGSSVEFDHINAKQARLYHSDKDWHVSDIRLQAWEDQCQVIPHAMDLSAWDLRNHLLWREKRSFTLLQTGKDDEPQVVAKPKFLPKAIVDGLRAVQHH